MIVISIILVSIFAAISIISVVLLKGRREKIENLNKSIAEIQKIKIGGVYQKLLIRGENKNKDVILFLHGGPGQGEIGYIREYQKELEKNYVIVRWDQRGAGASLSRKVKDESFNIDQFLRDTDEVTDYLRDKFNKEKIVLCGHSWGTILGILSVKEKPQKYLGYISVGQIVHMRRNEDIAYKFALNEAERQGDFEALEDLKGLKVEYNFQKAMRHRKYVQKYGGVIKTEPEISMEEGFKKSTEYGLYHKSKYQKNILRAVRLMDSEIFNINFIHSIKEVQIPIYFIAGKFDYTTVYPLIEEFFKGLKAPYKEFIVFEKSAHLPQLEEHKKFNKTIIRIVGELSKNK